MSIVLIPGAFRRDPHPVGKLAATLLSVAAAGMADPGRFRRGKSYVNERAVSRLEVSPGVVTATVGGSRADPYRVTIAAPSVTPPADQTDPSAYRGEMTRLVPDAGEIIVSCSCPDDGDPCKHGVAALLALAEEISLRPELVLAWRCADGPPVRARRAGLLPPPRPTGAPPAVNPYSTPEWRTFEGTDLTIPQLAVAAPRQPVWRPSAIDVSGAEELLQQMLATIIGWR